MPPPPFQSASCLALYRNVRMRPRRLPGSQRRCKSVHPSEADTRSGATTGRADGGRKASVSCLEGEQAF
eukprot:ctg_1194.g264